MLIRSQFGTRHSLCGLRLGDGIEDSLRPALVFGADHNDTKTMGVSLHLHALGIVNVQIDAKCRWILRGQTGKPVARQSMPMPFAVDDAIDVDAVQ